MAHYGRVGTMEVMLTFSAKYKKKKKLSLTLNTLFWPGTLFTPRAKLNESFQLLFGECWVSLPAFMKRWKRKIISWESSTKVEPNFYRKKNAASTEQRLQIKMRGRFFFLLLFIYLFGGQSKVLFSSQTENYTPDQRKRDRVGTLRYNKTGWFFFPFTFHLCWLIELGMQTCCSA